MTRQEVKRIEFAIQCLCLEQGIRMHRRWKKNSRKEWQIHVLGDLKFIPLWDHDYLWISFHNGKTYLAESWDDTDDLAAVVRHWRLLLTNHPTPPPFAQRVFLTALFERLIPINA